MRFDRIQHVVHRRLEQSVAALDAGIERPARRRIGDRLAGAIDIGREIEIVVLPARLAAQLRPDRVVVQEGRMRPHAEQRGRAVVAAPAAFQQLLEGRVGRPLQQIARGIFIPHAARHVVGMQSARRIGADARHRNRPLVAQPVDAQALVLGVDRAEIDAVIRPVLARMAARAIAPRTASGLAPPRPRRIPCPAPPPALSGSTFCGPATDRSAAPS